jgi:hypothetical protein
MITGVTEFIPYNLLMSQKNEQESEKRAQPNPDNQCNVPYPTRDCITRDCIGDSYCTTVAADDRLLQWCNRNLQYNLPRGSYSVRFTIKVQYNIPQTLTVTNSNANQSVFSMYSMTGEGFGKESVLYYQKVNGYAPVRCFLLSSSNPF